ncbi:MAG: hypothetical protein AAFQ67_08290 [Pseudomonadota bacterium]
MITRFIGLAPLAAGVWLGFQGLQALSISLSRGSDLATELFNPPTLFLRLLASLLLVIGGVSVTAAGPFGRIIATFGLGVLGFLVAAMAASGADGSLWRDEALLSAGVGIAVLASWVLGKPR